MIGMYREIYPPDYFHTPYSLVDCIAGSFFIIKGSIFNEIGYFDENTFLFYEEDILGYKLKRLGYSEAILNTVSYVHYEGISANRNIKYLHKYLAMQRSRLYFHRRYLKEPFYKMVLLYMATGLGIIENIIKSMIRKKSKLET